MGLKILRSMLGGAFEELAGGIGKPVFEAAVARFATEGDLIQKELQESLDKALDLFGYALQEKPLAGFFRKSADERRMRKEIRELLPDLSLPRDPLAPRRIARVLASLKDELRGDGKGKTSRFALEDLRREGASLRAALEEALTAAELPAADATFLRALLIGEAPSADSKAPCRLAKIAVRLFEIAAQRNAPLATALGLAHQERFLELEQALIVRSREHEQSLKDLQRLAQEALKPGPLNPSHSFSINGEREKTAIKAFRDRFRGLSPLEQADPRLLEELGRLEFGVGSAADAREHFEAAAAARADLSARVSALCDAQLAALEAGPSEWPRAVELLQEINRLAPGQTPFDLKRYSIERVLGSGGFGTAYLVTDSYREEQCVIKSLHLSELGRTKDELLKEGRTLNQLRHPSIVEFIDCGLSPDHSRPYFKMRYVPSQTLREVLRAAPGQVLSWDRTRAIVLQVAEAMAYAHAQKVIHRDLKPENILISAAAPGQPERAIVFDFGLALSPTRMKEHHERSQRSLDARGGSGVGTLDYAAPEQLNFRGIPVDERADLYSLAIITCEMLTGKPDFGRRVKSLVSAEEAELLEHCLEYDAQDRPSGMQAFLEALGGSQAVTNMQPDTSAQPPHHSLAPMPTQGSIITVPRLDLGREAAPAAPWAAKTGTDEFGSWALVRVKGVDFKMRWIPAGEFLMGSPDDEEGRFPHEGPQHRVRLTEGYWLADSPCTQELWEAVMGKNPSNFIGARRPVEMVSWNDVSAFLEKIDRQHSGLLLRLPTEAQWEYACRAGMMGPHYGMGLTGEAAGLGDVLDQIAWTDSNSGDETHDVKLLNPNNWGLYDMLGNVWEWCRDGRRHYSQQEVTDPIGPEGKGAARVGRGGSWGFDAWVARAAYRSPLLPRARIGDRGFRLSRGPAL